MHFLPVPHVIAGRLHPSPNKLSLLVRILLPKLVAPEALHRRCGFRVEGLGFRVQGRAGLGQPSVAPN